MNILQKIVADIQKDLVFKKQITPIKTLEAMPMFTRQTNSFRERILGSTNGIIAEHKRRSPSKPNLNFSLRVTDVARGYEKAGVSAMSVLTNQQYFGGSLEDLLLARQACNLPLLRKEFIVDGYQVIEAKAYGADAILLIAACLDRDEIYHLSTLAHDLGLEVLLEVHNAEELQKSIMPSLDLIGVNNRDLTTFAVSTETSMKLADEIPNDFVKISESGLSKPTSVLELQSCGYHGFLMGEHFIKTDDPGEAATTFIKELLS